MAVPILWSPGKCVLSAGKTMSVKFLLLGGGGSADFIFMGVRIFLNHNDLRSQQLGDWAFTTTGADAPGAAVPVKTSTGNNFLENAREFPEIITSTGAQFWLRFCLSVLVLVILSLRNNIVWVGIACKRNHNNKLPINLFKCVTLNFLWLVFFWFPCVSLQGWGRAKEVAKASCAETVVQKGVFGESVSTLPP